MFAELGFYTLAGAPQTSRAMLDEIRQAEQLGLGTAFISERFNIKEAATLTGAAAAVSSTITIATAATNHTTRHPIVTAAWASTMHNISGGRFSLGIGRGIDLMFNAFGIPLATTASMESFAGLMRQLWRGETVFNYSDITGSYPVLRLDPSFDLDIPLTLTAFGPNTLELGGRCFDNVVLHTFFTDDTTSRAVSTVKRAAEQAGRDPSTVKVWSCFATIGDHIDPALRLKKTVGRLATYLQAYGDLMVRTNNWDPDVLKRFRQDDFVSSFQGAIDANASTQDLERISPLIPEQWLAASATGSPQNCVAAIRRQRELGCDGVILHGATPTELQPIIDAYAM
ncbi:MAG: TIGR03857 family LLM class F420-dependent oxidoreductase [Ilumatobacteraceae bacterium]|nr:TIGR03857 family LLM class F420-dependent oxidoreductase [Ilumatobacteraceae bacterium]MBJ7487847.1 TIGR03857 family LLM class F420-dependent oxidoreductase [Ilumatobacteraceae bacterium]